MTDRLNSFAFSGMLIRCPGPPYQGPAHHVRGRGWTVHRSNDDEGKRVGLNQSCKDIISNTPQYRVSRADMKCTTSFKKCVRACVSGVCMTGACVRACSPDVRMAGELERAADAGRAWPRRLCWPAAHPCNPRLLCVHGQMPMCLYACMASTPIQLLQHTLQSPLPVSTTNRRCW